MYKNILFGFFLKYRRHSRYNRKNPFLYIHKSCLKLRKWKRSLPNCYYIWNSKLMEIESTALAIKL